MADREQVEKFLLMEPPAMIPTLSPVQDLKLDFSYKDLHNCLTCIELNLRHRDLPQNCALFRGQGCSPWCQSHRPPGGVKCDPTLGGGGLTNLGPSNVAIVLAQASNICQTNDTPKVPGSRHK